MKYRKTFLAKLSFMVCPCLFSKARDHIRYEMVEFENLAQESAKEENSFL